MFALTPAPASSPAERGTEAPHFSAHIYCDQSPNAVTTELLFEIELFVEIRNFFLIDVYLALRQDVCH